MSIDRGDRIGVAPIELALPGGRVLFSTRVGGLSDGPYRSLNLGKTTGDDPAKVDANRRLLLDGTGLDAPRLRIGRQVHGNAIRQWEGLTSEALEDAPDIDGHTTIAPRLGLLVVTADCFPVALSDGARMTLVHCGWRGVDAGILERAVAGFAGIPRAAVGPGIGSCCYEVGVDVAARFVPVSGDGPVQLDLRAVIDGRLRVVGVAKITHVELCTSCEEDLFFSHRRDGGLTGRQGALVWLEP